MACLKWREMAKLSNFININNRNLEEHGKPIQTPKTEPSAKATNNQGPLTAFEKRSVLDI